MKSLASVVAISLLGVSPISAECFERGKSAYKTPDGNWRKAAICVTDDGVQVYTRKTGLLVAAFLGADHDMRFSSWDLRRRQVTGSVLLGGLITIGCLALPVKPGYVTNCTHTSDSYSSSSRCNSYYDEGREGYISPKAALISLGALSGVVAAMALSPSSPPEYSFKDGPREVTVRVDKRDRSNWESALLRYRLKPGPD